MKVIELMKELKNGNNSISGRRNLSGKDVSTTYLKNKSQTYTPQIKKPPFLCKQNIPRE